MRHLPLWEGSCRGINRGDDCCSMMLSVVSNSSIVNITVTGETVVIDNVRLRPGIRIAAFYDTNLPVSAVYPPRYRAELVTTLRRGQQVKLDYFDENLTSSDNTLRLNLGPAVKYRDAERAEIYVQSGEFRTSCVLYDSYIQYTGPDDTSAGDCAV